MTEPAPARSPLTRAGLLWAGAGLLLAAAMIWLLWPRPTAVETALVDRGPVTREIMEEARVEVHDLHLVTAPVTGRLERISLHAGDSLRAGDLIARINPPAASLLDPRLAAEAQSAVTAARAGLKAAEARLALSQGDQQRTARLAASGFASPAALERADRTLAAAEAEVAARRADLLRAEASAGYRSGSQAVRTVRSPVSGTVLRVLQESEGEVVVGAPLIEIGDASRLEIVGEFLSQDAALIPEGASVTITGAGEAPLTGRVRLIEPYARTKISALGIEEQRVRVIIDFEAATSRVRLGHGYKVDAAVQVFNASDVLRVPTDALVRHNGGWAAFSLVGGRSRLRQVVLGDGDDSYRVIVSGIEEGERVILFPGDTLQDGDRVETAP